MIRVIGHREERSQYKGIFVDTTAKSGLWAQLSPFVAGPCPITGTAFTAERMENAWQFSKVYACHTDRNGEPTEAYWRWAEAGWQDPQPHRYPMGRGAKPLYSLWDGAHLEYLEARRRIYWPLYRDAVAGTQAFTRLQQHVACGLDLVLWDWDGYDYWNLGWELGDVLACSSRKMGHAFVLAAMLQYGPAVRPEDVFRRRAEQLQLLDVRSGQ